MPHNIVISESAPMSTPLLHFVFGLFPVISSPSRGHEFVPRCVAFIPRVPSRPLMTNSRSHLVGTSLAQNRIPIRFVSTPTVPRRFRQVARHRAHRLGVTLAQPQPPIQLADVALRAARVVDRLFSTARRLLLHHRNARWSAGGRLRNL